ncbi:MAG: DUF305 domain-containing protein, partial [Sphingomonadales bacterium]
MTGSVRPRIIVRATVAALLVGSSSLAIAKDAPIVQPGAPGKPARTLSAEEASKLAGATYSPADVTFMQGMIVHHQQAVDMAALAAERTNNEDVLAVAGRIDASQKDEMQFMNGWLSDRGEAGSESMAMNHGGHGGHAGHSTMKGMASPEQMDELAASNGTAFDRLFLQLMIRHHAGAVDMVDTLHRQPGAAYEPVMFEFTNDVVADQEAEIERMNGLLAGLSTDPRATLAAGFRDAGEAISNLRLVTAMPKPAGFFDPDNPAGLQPEKVSDDEVAAEGEDDKKPEFSSRASPLSFANTDMAFSGDMLVAGNYHGFNAYRLGNDGVPELVSSVVCPGGQGDVSIVGDILVMSVQDSRARVDCGLEGVQGNVSDERFRGVRIFDISDITNPRQVGQVQTCRGSHTHSIVSADDRRIVVYNSGTS